MRHRERHPAAAGPVPGCGPCRWRAVQVSPAATPTRSGVTSGDYSFQKDFAREWTSGDRDAYRRLRADNVQPPTIRGSAELERRASTRYEIETGQIHQDQAGLREALSIAADGGMDPLKPATTPRELE